MAVEEGNCCVKVVLRKGVCIVPITIVPSCNKNKGKIEERIRRIYRSFRLSSPPLPERRRLKCLRR